MTELDTAQLTECVRDLLTCSCLLCPNTGPSSRRVRVAWAMCELMGVIGNDRDRAMLQLDQLIATVMKQEDVYGIE